MLQGMDIGLMPLADNAWSRGKCSYKMLLYMSCGIPVVVSPVGMNAQVLGMGEMGFAVVSGSDWMNAIMTLIDEAELRRRMGEVGRKIVEADFSRQRVAVRLADVLKRIAGRI